MASENLDDQFWKTVKSWKDSARKPLINVTILDGTNWPREVLGTVGDCGRDERIVLVRQDASEKIFTMTDYKVKAISTSRDPMEMSHATYTLEKEDVGAEYGYSFEELSASSILN